MIPGDYPIARVQYGYTPVEKGAEGFVEGGGLEAVFKPRGSLSVGEVERPTQKANKRKLREGKPSLNEQRLEIVQEISSETSLILIYSMNQSLYLSSKY